MSTNWRVFLGEDDKIDNWDPIRNGKCRPRQSAFYKTIKIFHAAQAKLKKPRTVVLLPPVVEVLEKYLAGRTEGWLFPGYGENHISARQYRIS